MTAMLTTQRLSSYLFSASSLSAVVPHLICRPRKIKLDNKKRKPLQEVIEIQDEVKIKIGKGLQQVIEIDDEELKKECIRITTSQRKKGMFQQMKDDVLMIRN